VALRNAFSKEQRDAIRRRLNAEELAIFDAAAAPGARAWADVAPGPGVPALDGDAARVAHCLWLGAPIPELSTAADPLGRRRVGSDAAGRVHRHSGLVSIVGDLMVEAGVKVWHEVPGIYGPFPADMPAAARGRTAHGEARRMDLVGVTADLKGACVDPTLRDTAAPSVLGRAGGPAAVLAAAEADKEAHYADTPPPFVFSAFAAGMETNLGPGASQLLSDLSMRIATRRNGGEQPKERLLQSVKRRARARVGRAIMAQLAWQVSSAFVASPSAALAGATRYRHSAWRGGGAGRAAPCTCGADDVSGPLRACMCHAAAASQRG
jgi:hypothetical protein